MLFEPLRLHFVQLDALRPLRPWLAIAGLLMTIAFAVARLQVVRGNTTQPLAVASLFSVVALQTLQVGGQNFAPQNSAKELVETVRATFGELDPDAPFYSVRTYDQTLPFLVRRTVTLVAYTDEMALGLRMEPLKGIQTMGEFNERWRNNTRGYAVMPLHVYEEEAASGLPMQLLGRSARLVLVRR